MDQGRRRTMTYYDYDLQAWIVDGRVAACGHNAPAMVMGCYACQHAGEIAPTPKAGEIDRQLPELAAVRNEERATPLVAEPPPFTLTAQVSERKGHQPGLFNDAPAGWACIEADEPHLPTIEPARLHLTMTGVEAGRPFCDIDKDAARAAGDTFGHVPYSNLDRFFALPDICKACKAEWDAAADEPESTDRRIYADPIDFHD